MDDIEFMRAAIEEAWKGFRAGEVPIGALAVLNGSVIARAYNNPIGLCDPTAHAEISAIRAAAGEMGAYRLPGLELFVTLEPCLMCFGALIQARISRLVFGAPDPKVGFSRFYRRLLTEEAAFNHAIEVVPGCLEAECAALLLEFFKRRR